MKIMLRTSCHLHPLISRSFSRGYCFSVSSDVNFFSFSHYSNRIMAFMSGSNDWETVASCCWEWERLKDDM